MAGEDLWQEGFGASSLLSSSYQLAGSVPVRSVPHVLILRLWGAVTPKPDWGPDTGGCLIVKCWPYLSNLCAAQDRSTKKHRPRVSCMHAHSMNHCSLC
jgi:hypothetical protein